MTVWVCRACGAEYPESAEPPDSCGICLDDRQYVPPGGQAWVDAAELLATRTFRIEEYEPDLYGITVHPAVAIGQRTLLLHSEGGWLLWEPSAFFSLELATAVQEYGPVRAIASSHPHLAGASVSWSQALGGVPIYWNALDERWIRRREGSYQLWRHVAHPLPGVTLVEAGGHFPGSAVLHWAAGADLRGVLLTGDTVMITPGCDAVSFLRSYPNLLPLPERLVRQIVERLDHYTYDRLYGLQAHQVVPHDARRIVHESADRYVGWLRDELRDPDEAS